MQPKILILNLRPCRFSKTRTRLFLAFFSLELISELSRCCSSTWIREIFFVSRESSSRLCNTVVSRESTTSFIDRRLIRKLGFFQFLASSPPNWQIDESENLAKIQTSGEIGKTNEREGNGGKRHVGKSLLVHPPLQRQPQRSVSSILFPQR